MKIIDMRVRAPFAAYKDCMIFKPNPRGKSLYPLSPSAVEFSMDKLFQEANAANIEKMVVPVRKNCDGRNEDLQALIEQYPDKIVGLAGIDTVNIAQSLAEIEQFVVNGSCHGIIMEPGQDKTPWMVNDSWVYPIYDYCQKHNVPIFMTFGGMMIKNLRYYDPLALDDVLGAFPQLKIGIAHGGWPYVTEICHLAMNHHNLYIAPDFYLIEAPGWEGYVQAANRFISERIMFASAYPLMPLKESSEYYLHCGFKEEILPQIMYQNAKDFLGLQ